MLVIVSGGSDCNRVSLRTLYDLIPHPKDIISMFNSLSAVAVKYSDSPLMDPHRHHTVVSNICELELERYVLLMLPAIRFPFSPDGYNEKLPHSTIVPAGNVEAKMISEKQVVLLLNCEKRT